MTDRPAACPRCGSTDPDVDHGGGEILARMADGTGNCPDHWHDRRPTDDLAKLLERNHTTRRHIGQNGDIWCRECLVKWPCLPILAAARIRELEAENAQLVAAAEVLVDLGDDLANALEGDSFADADGALAAWRQR